jgi:broad specificity phosphatase PhoE
MINTKTISLIRHAESHANIGLKTSKPAEIQLTDKGHQQARELADSIHEVPDIVITSPFIRTLQTAKPLLEKFPQVKHEQWPIYEFTYLSPIRCHNTTMEQRIPWATEYWQQCDPDYCDGDGAESFSHFIERTRDALNKFEQRQEKKIIAFSHMLFISALNWNKQRSISKKIASDDMQNFKQYLFEKSVANCQIVPYSLT